MIYFSSLSFTHVILICVSIEYLKSIIYKIRNFVLEGSKATTIRKQEYINKWQVMLV